MIKSGENSYMQLLIAFVQKGFPGIPSYKKDIFEKPTLYTV